MSGIIPCLTESFPQLGLFVIYRRAVRATISAPGETVFDNLYLANIISCPPRPGGAYGP